FFFQAEDGIRDPLVTGVQTCALPIFWPAGGVPARSGRAVRGKVCGWAHLWRACFWVSLLCRSRSCLWARLFSLAGNRYATLGPKIGRASCRERVEMGVDDIS